MPARTFGWVPSRAVRICALAVVLGVLATACGSAGPTSNGVLAAGADGGIRFPDGSQFSPHPNQVALRSPLPTSATFTPGSATLPNAVGTSRQGIRSMICRPDGTIDTGPLHPVWTPPCVAPFNGKNGGATARGVTADTINVAYYVTSDATLNTAVRQEGGCGTTACTADYVNAYLDWFSSYFQFYGRRLHVTFISGSGADNDITAARHDADTIAGRSPPVFAALNGPREAGAAYALELEKHGIMCFCTVSLPQTFYAAHSPYVWSWYMASSQAYVHRAEYIGKRLARRRAAWAGSSAMKARNRSFGLVWFDDELGSYGPGVDFFKKQLAKYGVALASTIRYVGVEGCQTDAAKIVLQLMQADVTSVMFAGDPLCPISLTKAAHAAGATWEWLISGSYLTDTNFFARLYDQDQWSRAFGVSLEAPLAADGDWFQIYKQVRPEGIPKLDALDALRQLIVFATGIQMAGAKLTPWTFRAGMARTRPSGGTVTVPRISYGPKVVQGTAMWDATATDDMAEIWWDQSASVDDVTGWYRYVRGGHRYRWGSWPTSAPDVFDTAGTVLAYRAAPDQ